MNYKNKSALIAGVLAFIGMFPSVSSGEGTTSGATSTSGSGASTTAKGDCAPSTGGDPAKTCSGAGNPLNVANGNKYQREVDMAPLPGVLGLEIVRHYNSSYSGDGHINGIMGRGWKLSYETELDAQANSVLVMLPDGEKIVFARSPLNRNQCATLDPSQGTITIVHTDRGDEYLWSQPSGKQLTFNAKGKLTQIRVATGEFVSLQHDRYGNLVKVIDPQGRSLELSYLDPKERSQNAAKPRFSGVQHIDSPMGRFSYQYGSKVPAGSKALPIDVVANLVGVSRPVGPQSKAVTSRRYLYEDARHPTLLTGISIEGGKGGGTADQRIATFAYDERGWATRSEHGTAVDLVELTRASPAIGGKPGRAVLVHSKDAQHPQGLALEVQTVQLGGKYRIVETRGAACPATLNCPAGNVRYEYDELGHTKSVTDFAAPNVTYTDKGWQFAALSQPLRGDQYEYDSKGRIARHYEVSYGATAKSARPRLVEELRYDGDSERISLMRMPSVVAGQWREVEMGYNRVGQLTQRTERGWVPAMADHAARPIERTTSYQYALINGRSVLTSVDGPLPGVADSTRMQWDARGDYVVRTTTPDGVVSKVIARDASGRAERIAQDDGSRYSELFLSFENGLPVKRTRAAWLRQDRQLIEASRLVEATGYAYDDQQRLVGITRADGTQVKTEFGADGRPVRMVLPDGGQVVLKRDASGGLIEASRYDGDKLLQTVRFDKDAQQRLTGMADDLGQIVSLRYDGYESRPTEVEHAGGVKTRYSYDELGFMTEQVRAIGADVAQRTQWAHDAIGNVTSIDRGSKKNAIYDDFGRKLVQADQSHGMVLYVWDAADHLVAQIDESKRVSRFEYDAAGRLISSGAGQKSGDVRTRYDGHLPIEVAVQGEGRERKTWQYDSLGRLVEERHWLPTAKPLATPLLFVTTLRYDAQGRLSERTLTDAQKQAHRLTYNWDDATGHLNGIAYNGEPVVKDIHASWLAGISGFKHANGIEERFERDVRGRLVHHSAESKQAAILNDRYGYDADNHLITAEAASKSSTLKRRYEYDALGRLTGEKQDDNASVANEYAYDIQGNRIRSVIEGQTQRYAYAGQRLLAVEASGTRTGWAAAYDVLGQPHQDWSLQSVTKAEQVAANEQRIGSPSVRTVYGLGGRAMAAVDAQSKVVAQYGWGLEGERNSKTLTNGQQTHTTYYLYQDGRIRPVVADMREQGQQLQAEVDEQGAVRRQYIYLDGQVVACIDAPASTGMWAQFKAKVLSWMGQVPDAQGDIYAVHTDQRHAPVAVSNEQGQVVWRTTYTAFGQASVQAVKPVSTAAWTWMGEAHAEAAGSGFEFNLRMPGQYFDAERGLHYNLHRDYDPQTGRYTTPDPISMQAGLDLGAADRLTGGNVYGYVSANPLTSIDAQGWYEEDVHYYTTFFLALVAGGDYNEAKIIALATQYVDDNPLTQPINTDEKGDPEYIKSIWTNAERLKDYHFTLSDAATGQTEERYKNNKYKNPSSPQLDNLLNASKNAPTRCGQLQFYGEFLHAFEDTFGHRDKDDIPIDAVWRVPFTEKQLGIGHGLYGHEPDKTYNDDLDTDGTKKALGWYTREDRTEEMDHEVYDRLVKSFGDEAKAVPWEKVVVVMRAFNAIKENSEQDGKDDEADGGVKFKQKLTLLNNALDLFHLTRPDGSKVDFLDKTATGESYEAVGVGKTAASNRSRFLCDKDGKRLNQADYRGTILPSSTEPCN